MKKAFVQVDKDYTWLSHRGKISGGRPRIRRQLFFDNFRERIICICGNKFAIVGNIDAPDLMKRLMKFVKEVECIKSLVT